jgi:hypothetical protein
VFAWFWLGLGKVIGDRLPFWKDKSHLEQRHAADAERPEHSA